jgi:hypothetical protein
MDLGPALGMLSQIPWWTLMVYEGLWGLLPVNVLFAGMHIRNLIKWRKEARSLKCQFCNQDCVVPCTSVDRQRRATACAATGRGAAGCR